MDLKIPSDFKLLYSSKDIAKAVDTLGAAVSPWAQQVFSESGKDLLCVPILRGGIFFFADLVRAINASIELAPITTQAYVAGQNLAQTETVSVDVMGVESSGRSILLVDDICDSGRTLAAVKNVFLQQGAAEVQAATLIRREVADSAFNPEFVGFHFEGDNWFVGYGMEDGNRWRNLSDIYIIERDG